VYFLDKGIMTLILVIFVSLLLLTLVENVLLDTSFKMVILICLYLFPNPSYRLLYSHLQRVRKLNALWLSGRK